MGTPDAGDRIAQVMVYAAAAICLLNLYMVVNPLGWYEMIETVKHTGPANAHFLRDIGLIYVATAIILFYAARHLYGRWMAAAAGVLWLTFHAVLHIWEVVWNGSPADAFWFDSLGTIGVPLLVWVALAIHFARERVAPAGLPRAAVLGAMEKRLPGEFAYMREIAEAPGFAWQKFMNFIPASRHRYAAPSHLLHAARFGSVLVEDCGPCALTVAHGALEDGWTKDAVNTALQGRFENEQSKEAFAFGRAIAEQSPETFDLGDKIEAKHGRVVRLELAMTAALVRSYPAMKRGLGLTKSCALTQMNV